MSSPLSILGAGASLIGGVVGARGALQSGRAAADASEFNREIGVGNATQALQSTATGVDRLRYAAYRLRAAQRAGYAAAGVDVGSGSPEDVYADTSEQLKLAELVMFYEGELSATEAMNRAQIAGLTGQAAQTAANYSAGASLLGGLGGTTTALSRVDWSKIF
jgi:hypothetical protein